MFQATDKFSHGFVTSAIKLESVKTDTLVFRLHYKLSIWILVFYSFAYMSIQWKLPLTCVFFSKEIGSDAKVMNDWCWIHGIHALNSSHRQAGINYPGVGGSSSHNEVAYHTYYMWTYVFMTVMIIMLLTPRQLWRYIENGRMKMLTGKLRECDIEMEKHEEENLAEFLFIHLGCSKIYSIGFILCEILNLVVVFCQLVLFDMISAHELTRHGLASLTRTNMNYPALQRMDSMAKAFPLMGGCDFKRYGPSGNIEEHNGLCVVPLNLMNERAVLFFWYYNITLFIVGLLAVARRLVLVMSKRARRSSFISLTPLTPYDDAILVMEACSYSDWFVIDQVGSCLAPVWFREVMEMFVMKLRTKTEAK